jgi:molecular chaperone GrpE
MTDDAAAEESDGDDQEVDYDGADVDLDTIAEDAIGHDEPLEDVFTAAEEAGVGDAFRALASRIADLEEETADLEEENETLRREKDNAETQLKRKQADFENYKKRAKREQERIKEHATAELLERLLDVRDNLDRALEESDSDADTLREGVRMTLSEFDRVLDGEDVHRIEPEPGDRVDPERHEVLMRVESDQPAGHVDERHRTGYEMGGQVLREAQVTVSEDG